MNKHIKPRRSIWLAVIIVIVLCGACSQKSTKANNKEVKVYTAHWDSLKTHPVPEWFEDAKFGIFIHWGAYSAIGYHPEGRGYAEHAPKYLYAEPDTYYPFMDSLFGGYPPEFGYKDVIPQFKAEKWDPDAWADLFDRAGAKYVVLTAEHHDGFALWDSDLTPWCATKVGPLRDLVGDLGVAVRNKGIKYAPSYHRERHTGFFAKEKNAIQSPPRPDVAEEIKRMPKAELLYGPFEFSDAFIKDYVGRWQEIQEKYQPDFMWIDAIPIFQPRWAKDAADHDQVHKYKEACKHMITDYLNAAEKWGKEVYLNNKGPHGAHNWPEGIGCREKDNLKMDDISVKWQNPATLGTSYGYMKFEEDHDAYKSPEELIRLLSDVVSKNGNLLLNIGPRADGTIPEGMERRLLAIGEWLDVNGEAIYGSRPWKVFGEQQGEIVLRDQVYQAVYDREFRFTASKDGKSVYVIVYRPSQPILLGSFTDEDVKSVELLGGADKPSWALDSDGLSVKISKSNAFEIPIVLKIELK